ncbi:MAG: PilZ domain-containing protein [Acidobacteria bacterium]|nr:PilZ domain-containing protein [Acidobacteriota bacterium]
MLCADLVDLHWKDQSGKSRRVVANLEDISASGACVQLDKPLALGAKVRLTHPKGELTGVIRYCVFREIGYFLGVEFDADCRWSMNDYRPQHLLDPRRMVRERTEASKVASSQIN